MLLSMENLLGAVLITPPPGVVASLMNGWESRWDSCKDDYG